MRKSLVVVGPTVTTLPELQIGLPLPRKLNTKGHNKGVLNTIITSLMLELTGSENISSEKLLGNIRLELHAKSQTQRDIIYKS